MERRNFFKVAALAGGATLLPKDSLFANPIVDEVERSKRKRKGSVKELKADVVIIGGGMGGVASALAACRNGLHVVMTEETDWIGGQATQQAVPLDEHRWIETCGGTAAYREYRNRIQDYYRKNYPLTKEAAARKSLNPGAGFVSRLCHEPRVSLAVMTDMLSPYISNGKLTLLLDCKAEKADVTGDEVKHIQVYDSKRGESYVLTAPYFVDATECGDLLPMTGTEYVLGAESKAQTNELHAQEIADPNCQQSFTVCFALDYVPGEDFTIEKPKDYDFWRNYTPDLTPAWPGKLLDLSYSDPFTFKPKRLDFHPEGKSFNGVMNWWNYRRIIYRHNFEPGFYEGDISLLNWPQQDYLLGNIVDVSEKEYKKHVEGAKNLNRSFLYWLQTEVPRPEGGYGWKGLRLRKDICGTEDGMAKYPYIREARRIQAEFTVTEEHVGVENRKLVASGEAANRAEHFFDSVGTGYYRIDLHPTTTGVNYIDIEPYRFEIPLGALLPKRMNNLIPAAKNIGTTHITNGCYRLHPVEWSIGEAVGMLVTFAKSKKVPVRAVRADKGLLSEFQRFIETQGLETRWPNV